MKNGQISSSKWQVPIFRKGCEGVGIGVDMNMSVGRVGLMSLYPHPSRCEYVFQNEMNFLEKELAMPSSRERKVYRRRKC